MNAYDEKVTRLKDLEKEIVDLHRVLENKRNIYAAEFKAAFDIDLTKAPNVDNLFEAFKRVREMQ